MGEYKPPDKFKVIFVRVLGFYFAVGILFVLNDIMPRTRTYFKDYQAYLDSRRVGENYGSSYFEDELPAGAEDMKYYSKYVIVANITAYSMILPEDTYMDFRKSRINFYVEKSNDWACSLLYERKGDERWYIDGSEWYEKKAGLCGQCHALS